MNTWVTNSPDGLGKNAHERRYSDNRRFISWDGEGINTSDGHKYVLFGCSDGNHVKTLSGRLSTEQCFQLLQEVREQDSKAIHVAFAFDYDVNMMLSDLSVRKLRRLHETGVVRWYGWRIEWRNGKWFSVSWPNGQIDKNGCEKRTAIRIWDIFSFFGCSFIKALQQYLPDVDIEKIEQGKPARGNFSYEQLDSFIVPYWKQELETMVMLANSLRARLYDAGYFITKWHGPGAVASYLFEHNGTREVQAELPDKIKAAARYGYAGGRFERFRVGHTENTVYEYDIRSAYPAVISTLPGLAGKEWRYIENPERISSFGIYYFDYSMANLGTQTLLVPSPAFRRRDDGNIVFPTDFSGMYWSPEASCIMHAGGKPSYGYELIQDEDRPFSWVADLYEKRQELKKKGDPSQLAHKLGLNSLYGKMAQRLGWDNNGAPQWHNLAWAGYVTAGCREKVWKAATVACQRDALVTIETDAVFSLVPLRDELDIGPGLGQWEEKIHYGLTYVQCGLYWHRNQYGDWQSKIRGLDKDSMTHGYVLGCMRDKDRKWVMNATTTRFLGLGYALNTRMSNWQKWHTGTRAVSLADEKRVHPSRWCPDCENGATLADTMHKTLNIGKIGASNPHDIPWEGSVLLDKEGVQYV